ncbi:UDP-GlcNAc:betaGal beta-1,3-N-acetylglucosaminyltransferase 7-like [Triplophysa rosa]|uniref:UDP-GlcNAc:betaGal beta-1,3-N-acetylglucosaminyltransferase 7-like n=1 Tax=Triplophysa rosa TaxID=992332 RepID=UPI00254602D9|nr:UDP-GlcNAc:betaGal beta-1,3-N-acetylglucosaminyltransferase 7-like [Triplophysa rosa]
MHQQFLLYRHCRYFPILMNHPEKCAGDVDLLLVIKSVVTQYDRREVIRQTWCKELTINGKNIKSLFLLGTSSIEEERATHQKLLGPHASTHKNVAYASFHAHVDMCCIPEPPVGGGGFLMGSSTQHVKLKIPIDDVFLGMSLKVLQVSPIKHDAFKTFGIVRNEASKMNREPCFFRDMLVLHKPSGALKG